MCATIHKTLSNYYIVLYVCMHTCVRYSRRVEVKESWVLLPFFCVGPKDCSLLWSGLAASPWDLAPGL